MDASLINYPAKWLNYYTRKCMTNVCFASHLIELVLLQNWHSNQFINVCTLRTKILRQHLPNQHDQDSSVKQVDVQTLGSYKTTCKDYCFSKRACAEWSQIYVMLLFTNRIHPNPLSMETNSLKDPMPLLKQHTVT